jgi:FkbM family methyltransferase
MSNLTQETMLPNGLKIFCIREEEVPILYQQINEYFRNGIELHEGDTVFDVGANIGLFSLWVYELCNKNVDIYAFEPIPSVFDVLRANAQRFNPEKIKALPYGLSQESKTLNFAYHLNATALSTAYPDNSKEEQHKLKQAVLRNLKDAPPSVRWLRWLPAFLRSLILDRKINKAFKVEQVTCQMKTVSEIIREYNIQNIDLLKVDVERSELDVLLGIAEQDWAKIKQVVIEIHDLDHRVEQIMTLLKKYGLSKITIEQETIFKNSDIFNLYALRSSM